MARALLSRGVGPEDKVAICLRRSVELVVAILGTMKAGAAFMPMDLSQPTERLSYMLDDSGARVLIIERERAEDFDDRIIKITLSELRSEESKEGDRNFDNNLVPDSLAYVMYTSGSTGQPKAVMGTHRGTITRFEWMWATFPFEHGEVGSIKTSITFADFLWETFGPLLKGVQSVIIGEEAGKDVYALIAELADAGVTRIVLVPSLLGAILDSGLESEGKITSVKILDK